MGLTMTLAVAADVREPSRLSPWFMAVLGIVIVAKARLILGGYLELAPRGGMMKGLVAMIAMTLAVVIGSFGIR
jgi:hypothetical protein